MKILLLNWQDPENPQAGGAERHLWEIFGRLARRGHQIRTVVSGWNGSATRSVSDGIEIVRTGGRYSYGLLAPIAARRLLVEEPADLVIEALNKVPLYTPLWTDTPSVLLVHHLFGTTAFQQAGFPLAAATWIQERPIPAVYRTTAVHAISESTADDLVDRGLQRERIEVIHPGVDLQFFSPASPPTRAKSPTFVYVGRLQPYKSVDHIIRAFAEVVRKAPNARLIIAGRGEEEASLKKLAHQLSLERQINFAGYVTETEKRDLFRMAWANVFVSPNEGWGMTNLEAAACGTPAIASDSPGLRESVRDGDTGKLVPWGDIDALGQALSEFASRSEMVEEFGRNARDYAETLDWDSVADRTEKHLASVIRANRYGG